jgi:hypothetical protein
MPLYDVTLVRNFKVLVKANSPEEAAHFAEFYMGYDDLSSESDRNNHHFQIHEIEMTWNDAIEVNRSDYDGI